MAYALGAVKAHVKDAANHFGRKHGYAVVYGWRAVGSVPGSDHPKGLALDFMGSNRAKGDALAADLIANAGAWNVTYVIWNRRIWRRGTGRWEVYSGPSPHTDHVHASFGDSGGSGVETVPVAGSNPLVPDWMEDLKAIYDYIDEGFRWLGNGRNWMRIGMFSVGFILIIVAIAGWSAVSSGVNKVSNYARS